MAVAIQAGLYHFFPPCIFCIVASCSTIPRVLTYEVEDSNGAINVLDSTLQITIIPVNDRPFLFFVTSDAFRFIPIPVPNGLTAQSFRYTEDDVPLNFGQSIYLRDFDSNISMAILVLESKWVH